MKRILCLALFCGILGAQNMALASAAPNGDYKKNCTNCRVEKGDLICDTCTRDDGSKAENVILEDVEGCSLDNITNHDGELRCAPLHDRSPLSI